MRLSLLSLLLRYADAIRAETERVSVGLLLFCFYLGVRTVSVVLGAIQNSSLYPQSRATSKWNGSVLGATGSPDRFR